MHPTDDPATSILRDETVCNENRPQERDHELTDGQQKGGA